MEIQKKKIGENYRDLGFSKLGSGNPTVSIETTSAHGHDPGIFSANYGINIPAFLWFCRHIQATGNISTRLHDMLHITDWSGDTHENRPAVFGATDASRLNRVTMFSISVGKSLNMGNGEVKKKKIKIA